jgi:hypothetical protein
VTRYVDHLADAWAESWSSDDAPAFARIYAREVVWWDVARGRGAEHVGHEGLAGARDDVRAGAPRVRIFVERLVAGDPWIAVEFVAVAPESGRRVGVPGCAWWRLDDDGRITREHWYWEWRRRRTVDDSLAGHTMTGGEVTREARWYRTFVAELLGTWDGDPPTMVDAFYASNLVFDTMGAGPELVFRGADALRSAERRLGEQLVERSSTVGEVVGVGPIVAFTHFTDARTERGERRTTPVARVLTLDDDERVLGDHTYLLRAWPKGSATPRW